jgi:hypothetical protein
MLGHKNKATISFLKDELCTTLSRIKNYPKLRPGANHTYDFRIFNYNANRMI